MTLLEWSHLATELTRPRRSFDRTATPEECAAVAAALQVPQVKELKAHYELSAISTGRYKLVGELRARLVQTCVVSLEPIENTLELPFEAEFRTDPDQLRNTGSNEDEVEILTLPDFEPIENGQLAVGRVVFDTLGSGIDPYPRKEGAIFNWSDEEGARAISPFSALAKLKRETP